MKKTQSIEQRWYRKITFIMKDRMLQITALQTIPCKKYQYFLLTQLSPDGNVNTTSQESVRKLRSPGCSLLPGNLKPSVPSPGIGGGVVGVPVVKPEPSPGNRLILSRCPCKF